tara:strand:- start:801 stop:983 length:183 start_codon:yes stop_codon:yes gene_type:complete
MEINPSLNGRKYISAGRVSLDLISAHRVIRVINEVDADHFSSHYKNILASPDELAIDRLE